MDAKLDASTFRMQDNQMQVDANQDGVSQGVNASGGQVDIDQLISALEKEGFSRSEIMANLDTIIGKIEAAGATVVGLEGGQAPSVELQVPLGDTARLVGGLTVDASEVSKTDATIEDLAVASSKPSSQSSVAGLEGQAEGVRGQIAVVQEQIKDVQAQIVDRENQIRSHEAEIGQLHGTIGRLNSEIAMLTVNMAELQKMIVELQQDHQDLQARLSHALEVKKIIAEEKKWVSPQIDQWSKGNPFQSDDDGAIGSRTLGKGEPPTYVPVEGGIADNGLAGPPWGTESPALVAARDMLGRDYPNQEGEIRIQRTQQPNISEFKGQFAAFTETHRPVGDARTDPEEMVAALEKYSASLDSMLAECDAEIASIKGQLQLIEVRIGECQGKIEECKQGIEARKQEIERCEARIEELQAKIKQLREQVKELKAQQAELRKDLEELQKQLQELQQQMAELQAEMAEVQAKLAEEQVAEQERLDQGAEDPATDPAKLATYNLGDLLHNQAVRGGGFKA